MSAQQERCCTSGVSHHTTCRLRSRLAYCGSCKRALLHRARVFVCLSSSLGEPKAAINYFQNIVWVFLDFLIKKKKRESRNLMHLPTCSCAPGYPLHVVSTFVAAYWNRTPTLQQKAKSDWSCLFPFFFKKSHPNYFKKIQKIRPLPFFWYLRCFPLQHFPFFNTYVHRILLRMAKCWQKKKNIPSWVLQSLPTH